MADAERSLVAQALEDVMSYEPGAERPSLDLWFGIIQCNLRLSLHKLSLRIDVGYVKLRGCKWGIYIFIKNIMLGCS